ncbi:MAG: glycosyltransferase N-terminal domain-containing protein [Verrucomicrobiota bacterium]
MIWIYRLLFLPALLLALPYYWWRMYRRGGYRHDFHHRFGLIDRPPPKQPGTRRIWIQAVSVGEIRALSPLIEALQGEPELELVITTTTSTGYAILREEVSPRVLKVGIFPVDFVLFSRNAWRRLDPDLAILMEGEIWPEHLHQARQRSVPVMLINGRLSDKSFRRYAKFPGLSGKLFRQLDTILAATPYDQERFLKLSAAAQTTSVTGSLKLDAPVGPLLTKTEGQALLAELGFADASDHPIVLLGSSTWPGEEGLLLDVLKEALAEGLNVRLLLIPRHAERRADIISLLEAQPLPWHLRTQAHQAPGPVMVYIADTTGEMVRLSQVADLAFIGKSLPPHDGGQTPVEAAALGIPLVYGPKMSNFRHICRQLQEYGAAIRCEEAESVHATLLELLRDQPRRQAIGSAGQRWHAGNQGATKRVVEAIREALV